MIQRRLPLIPTLLVGAAIAVMIALGVWQIARALEKESLIALYRANLARPAVTFPALGPVPRDAMFRLSSVNCLQVASWRQEGGRAADGTIGTRHIAACRTSAEGPGALVDMGVTQDPGFRPRWAGGMASGVVTTEPDHGSLIGKLFGQDKVLLPMLVAERPAPGLTASARPSPDSVPNNHRAYAVQWFLFAAVAGIIYGLALRGRMRAGDAKK